MKFNKAMIVAYIALIGFVLSVILRMKIDGVSLLFFVIGALAFLVALNTDKLEQQRKEHTHELD